MPFFTYTAPLILLHFYRCIMIVMIVYRMDLGNAASSTVLCLNKSKLIKQVLYNAHLAFCYNNITNYSFVIYEWSKFGKIIAWPVDVGVFVEIRISLY